MRKHTLHNTTRLALLCVSFLSAPAHAVDVDEVESNQPIGSAQLLSGGETITVRGVIGQLFVLAVPDADFYSFYAEPSNDPTKTINIETYGMSGTNPSPVNTFLAVFGPGPDYKVLRYNADIGYPPGPGHDYRDAKIPNFKPEAAGIYTVGVTSAPCTFRDGGVLLGLRGAATCAPYNTYGNGRYSLVISGVGSPVMQINIDIKPGSGTSDAPINPKSKGKIPVALLSSADFNAVMVNVDSLRFGPTGTEAEANSCGKDGEDVNGDGRLDLVCHFDNQSAGFSSTDAEGMVRGEIGASAAGSSAASTAARHFEGRGFLKITPVQRVY